MGFGELLANFGEDGLVVQAVTDALLGVRAGAQIRATLAHGIELALVASIGHGHSLGLVGCHVGFGHFFGHLGFSLVSLALQFQGTHECHPTMFDGRLNLDSLLGFEVTDKSLEFFQAQVGQISHDRFLFNEW